MAIKFGNSLDLNNNELLNAVIQNLAGDSTTQKAGLIWFDTTNGIKRIKVYDGTSVKQIPYVGEKASDSDKLGGTAATAFLTKTEANSTYATKGLMGASNGIATLGEDGKVPSTQLPDYLLGQLLYGGTIVNNVATVSQKFKDRFGYSNSTLTITANNATSYEGVYFIARGTNSVIAGNTVAGDWVVSDGISWNKIDNTDAVVSVAGLTGTITTDDLSNALGLDEFVTSTEFQDIVDTANSALQSGESGQVAYLTVSKSGTKLTITPIIGLIGGSDGLALTSDIEEKVIGQSGDTKDDMTLHGVKAYADDVVSSRTKKYTSTLAATANQTVTVTHNLNTETVIVSLYTTQGEQVYADVQIASASTVKVTFGNIANQTLKVVVIG